MEEYRFIQGNGFVFVSGPYTANTDIAENIGETWEDYLEGKYLLLNEDQISFLEENPSATPEEVWNLTLNENAGSGDIKALVAKIEEYDSSDKVNIFYINDEAIWFNKETRTSLNNSVSIEKESGKDTSILWVNEEPHTIQIDELKQMLMDLELYAVKCFNNTQKNIKEAKALTLKSEINAFDITKGYPEKLRFNL